MKKFMENNDFKKRECDKLFVYGSLQHGQSRNYILQDLKFEKAILPNFKKVSPPSLGFPFIIQNKDFEVNGEIYYGLDDNLFKSLDLIEGEGSLYHRIIVKVITAKGEETECFVYYPGERLIKMYI